jgi:hypothetical protein
VQARQTDIPVLVKAGAVLPLQTMALVQDVAPDPLVLQVVLGCRHGPGLPCEGVGFVYEDDGERLAYETDREYRVARVAHNSRSSGTTITIEPRAEGSGYSGERASCAYQLELPVPGRGGGSSGVAPIVPAELTVDGKTAPKIPGVGDGRALGWYHATSTGLYEGALLAVETGPVSTEATITIVVRW